MTKARPTLIGTFVLGSLGFVVAAVLFFAGGALRDERLSMVSFFDGSVAGLQVGAVTFWGVPVGEVKSMGVRFNPDTGRSIKRCDICACRPSGATKGCRLKTTCRADPRSA
jgi:paraquat-inducible protein B